jgi:EAL domain-containing protein (putative c-di-GMP-specific phosphodiesterase class I)
VFSGDTWLSRLSCWLGEIEEETRDSTRGMELGGGLTLSPWNSIPLETLVTRIETPWIGEILAPDNLAIHLQPILWVENVSIVAFEALARGSLDGRQLNGGEILRAATAHERLIEFERQALESAATKAYPKLREGESLFLNILPQTLGDPDAFEQQILRTLVRRGVDMTQIVFEIVETDELPPLRDLLATIERIRAYGSLAAIDDLGAGCASYTCLLEIEPDIVKLDRSLLAMEEQSSCGILQSLASCAHSVGALVVAEGIEGPEQFQLVRQAGVDMAQGWFIGRPALEPVRRFRDVPFLS